MPATTGGFRRTPPGIPRDGRLSRSGFLVMRLSPSALSGFPFTQQPRRRVVIAAAREPPTDQHLGGRIEARLRDERVAEGLSVTPRQWGRPADEILIGPDLAVEALLTDLMVDEELPPDELGERASDSTSLVRVPAALRAPQHRLAGGVAGGAPAGRRQRRARPLERSLRLGPRDRRSIRSLQHRVFHLSSLLLVRHQRAQADCRAARSRTSGGR
jgi:hypothetical protein